MPKTAEMPSDSKQLTISSAAVVPALSRRVNPDAVVHVATIGAGWVAPAPKLSLGVSFGVFGHPHGVRDGLRNVVGAFCCHAVLDGRDVDRLGHHRRHGPQVLHIWQQGRTWCGGVNLL